MGIEVPVYLPEIQVKSVMGEPVVVFRDRLGRTHDAPPLTWGDDRELAMEFGVAESWSTMLDDKEKSLRLLWQSVRKGGLTESAIAEARKTGNGWSCSIDDVREWFASGHVMQVVEILLAILNASGFVATKGGSQGNPTAPAATPVMDSPISTGTPS